MPVASTRATSFTVRTQIFRGIGSTRVRKIHEVPLAREQGPLSGIRRRHGSVTDS